MVASVIGVTIAMIVITGIGCAVIHEFGHWITAKIFGADIKFALEFGKLFGVIPIPRGIWRMPEKFSKTQKKIVAIAGFGFEFIASLIAVLVFQYWIMMIIFILHIGLYKFYAGDASDFQWL